MVSNFGSLINIKIENMREQHLEIVGENHVAQNAAKKEITKHPYAIVTVAMGSGIAELLKSCRRFCCN